MFMSFFNALPLPVLILLGFALLGFCNYLNKLRTWRAKINMFSNYREVLVEFHNNAMAGKDIDPKLNHYLLENALKITLDSIIYIRKDDPIRRTSTGIMDIINDIVTLKGYDFTETCQDFDNMLIQNIGAFKDRFQKARSQIINPIYLVKNGVSLTFNIIPIVNLIPTKIKDFLSNLFVFMSIVDTLSSLLIKKSLLLSIIRQIITRISQSIP